jgi:hypothetical protein
MSENTTLRRLAPGGPFERAAAAVIRGALAATGNYGGGVPAQTCRHAGLAHDASAAVARPPASEATGAGGVGTYAVTSLTVAADTQAMTFGGGVPALTCKHSGLAHGGAGAAFTGGPAATANGGSAVGSYPVTQGAPAATGDYATATFNGGTLALSDAPHPAGTATSHFGGNELAKFTDVGAERVPYAKLGTSRPAPSSAPPSAAWAARAP